jgi:polyisoprenoid-binding protein YceI
VSWRFDPIHSSVELAVRHMLVSRVRGRFTRWQGWLDFDPERPEDARLEVAIDAASLDTGHPARDEDLRSPRFLDVARFPLVSYRSLAIDRLGETRFRMSGEAAMHGVTRPVVLDVEAVGRMVDPQGLERAGFVATGCVDRRDFGVTFNQVLDIGGVALGNRVELAIEVAAVRQCCAGEADLLATTSRTRIPPV